MVTSPSACWESVSLAMTLKVKVPVAVGSPTMRPSGAYWLRARPGGSLLPSANSNL